MIHIFDETWMALGDLCFKFEMQMALNDQCFIFERQMIDGPGFYTTLLPTITITKFC